MNDTATTTLPPDTLRRRFFKADRERLMRHAESLECQMRILAALLESRDAASEHGGTFVSIRAVAEAKRLAGATS